jgi:hypothetical protein
VKAYLRLPIDPDTRFSQAQATAILMGRWVHLKSLAYGLWFAPQRRGSKLPPGREDTLIWRIPLTQWLRLVGPRGYLEILEDLLGIRACYLARFLLKLFKRSRRLRWVACMDQLQDFSLYDRQMQPPYVSWGKIPDDFMRQQEVPW